MSSQLIASLIDRCSVILLFIGLGIWEFRRSKKPDAKKRPWLYVVGLIVVFIQGILLFADISHEQQREADSRIPTKDELGAMFEWDSKTTIDESVVTLRKGMTVNIPKGFKYITPKDGGLLLFASGNRMRLTIAYGGETRDLNAVEKSTRETAKKKNRTWIFGPSNREKINSQDALTMDITDTANNAKGLTVLRTDGHDAFILTLMVPMPDFDTERGELRRILNSFTAVK